MGSLISMGLKTGFADVAGVVGRSREILGCGGGGTVQSHVEFS